MLKVFHKFSNRKFFHNFFVSKIS